MTLTTVNKAGAFGFVLLSALNDDAVKSAITWYTNSPVGGHVVHAKKSSQWSNVM